MAALSGQPWRANATVRVTNGTGTRHFRLGFDAAFDRTETGDGDNPDWEASPGNELIQNGASLFFGWDTTSPALAPPQATVARIRAYLPGTGTQVGSTISFPISGDDDFQEVKFHFDSDPFNGVAGAARAGMVEWYFEVERDSGVDQWGPADTRGGFTSPGLRSHDWAAGYARAWSTLDSHSVSNVSIGGAEPSLFAYPDPIYVRTTLDAVFFGSDTMQLEMRQSGILRRVEGQTGSGPSFDFEEDSTSERVDNDFVVAAVDFELQHDTDSFGGDDEYRWADSGHEVGWTRISDNRLDYVSRFDVDPTLTIINESLDNVASTVFNRNEDQGGSFEVQNARAESFTPLGTETVTVERVADGTDEDSASVSRVSGVTNWDVTFGTSGNNAPADATGDEKRLVWDDVASGVDTGKPTTSPIGFLSSLLDVTEHLQLNDNVLDPNLDTDLRLTSDLGFYSILITNQRGQGKNGVSVTDHLRDDGDLVDQIDRTDTTATQNGNDGYLPLKAWDSGLPGGGWDHWTDAGSFEGNTFEQTRLGLNQANYTLLSKDPNLVVVPGAGAATTAEDGDHWHPGDDLQIGLAVYDAASNTTVAVDTDGGGDPRAYVVLARFNVALGRAEYLELDDQTWSPITGGVAIEHQLAVSPGDANAYVTIIDGADTATWNEADLFILGIAYINSTPYSLQNIIPVVEGLGPAHDEAKYSLDPLGLGVHGILSQR